MIALMPPEKPRKMRATRAGCENKDARVDWQREDSNEKGVYRRHTGHARRRGRVAQIIGQKLDIPVAITRK